MAILEIVGEGRAFLTSKPPPPFLGDNTSQANFRLRPIFLKSTGHARYFSTTSLPLLLLSFTTVTSALFTLVEFYLCARASSRMRAHQLFFLYTQEIPNIQRHHDIIRKTNCSASIASIFHQNKRFSYQETKRE